MVPVWISPYISYRIWLGLVQSQKNPSGAHPSSLHFTPWNDNWVIKTRKQFSLMPFWETNLNGVWNDKRVLLGQGQVEQAQELAQRGLIHHVHHAHLRDQKVQNASSCGNYTQKRRCQQRPCLHLVLTSIWDTTRHGPFVSEPRKKSLILWLIASGSDCMIKISNSQAILSLFRDFLLLSTLKYLILIGHSC